MLPNFLLHVPNLFHGRDSGGPVADNVVPLSLSQEPLVIDAWYPQKLLPSPFLQTLSKSCPLQTVDAAAIGVPAVVRITKATIQKMKMNSRQGEAAQSEVATNPDSFIVINATLP
jgi:hypothetical protein